MLGIMRKYKRSIIIKIVFGVIVLSFIGTMFLVWGEGEKGLEGSGYAVKVNRTKVPYEDFLQKYNQLRNMYQQLSDKPLTPEMEKQLGLRQLVVDNIVNTVLLSKEARRMGIKVAKDEIVNAIATIPAFQKDGAFSSDVYLETLRANRLTPQAFEEGVKEELLLKKVRRKIMDEVRISDEEALQVFKKERDKINLLVAAFDPAKLKSEIKITDADMNDYLQQHPDEFRIPEKISLSYVALKPEHVAGGLEISSEEALGYYQKNIDRYQDNGNILPFEEVRDRVRVDALKVKAAKKAYEMAANALHKNLESANIEGVARTLNVAVEKTPLFPAKQPPAAISGENRLVSKAFTLKQGELGGPVETEKGIYIFKINEKKPAALPPLAQVRTQVEKLVSEQKARELARKKAAEALELLAKGKKPDNLAETGLFAYSATGDIPEVGKSPELMNAAFDLSLKAPTPSSPFKVGDRWYAVKLKNRVEAETKDFQQIKAQIIQNMLPAKQEEAVAKRLDELKSESKIEINPLLLADQ